jgi:hypothetical protein
MLRLLPSTLIAFALAMSGCTASAEKNTTQARPVEAKPDEAMMLRQRGKVAVKTRQGRELRLDVEIASDDKARSRGLMHRASMPEMAGMIFIFPERRVHEFWMMNTLLALDMLFIDTDGTVVGIVEMAEPLTTTRRQVGEPSQRVLEVNGGWCGRHGVAAGDKVELEGMFELR